MLKTIEENRDRIDPAVIEPHTTWASGREDTVGAS